MALQFFKFSQLELDYIIGNSREREGKRKIERDSSARACVYKRSHESKLQCSASREAKDIALGMYTYLCIVPRTWRLVPIFIYNIIKYSRADILSLRSE